MAAVFLAVALLAAVLGTTENVELKCLCTTPACQESNEPICVTSGLCYTQLLDKKDGSNPITKGCVNRKTPLLCENRPPKSLLKRLKWPILFCCSSDLCNQGEIPSTYLITHVTEDNVSETTSISPVDAVTKKSNFPAETLQSDTGFQDLPLDGANSNRPLTNPAVLTVFSIGLLALLAIGIVGCCVLHKQNVN